MESLFINGRKENKGFYIYEYILYIRYYVMFFKDIIIMGNRYYYVNF